MCVCAIACLPASSGAGSPAGSVRVRVSSSKLREISSPLVSPAGSRAEGGRGRVGDRVLRDVTPYALTPLRGQLPGTTPN